MAFRIVQWTSGRVARETIPAVVHGPDLELVGLYAYSPEKVGRDAGELVGVGKVGVQATNDAEALLALKPDAVVYSPLYPDVNELVRILEAGVNIVTTCNFITGWGLDYRADKYGPNARKRIDEAARRGGVSIFGTGINPGYINYLACIASSVCRRVERIRVTEAIADIVPFLGDPNILEFGYGKPLDTPGLEERQKSESSVFGDAIELMASLMEIPLDEIRFASDLAPATVRIETPGGTIEPGMIAGVRLRWEGVAKGRTVLENHQVWIAGPNVAEVEAWGAANRHGYHVDIEGDPNVSNVFLPTPPGDLSKLSMADHHALGMRITGLPLVNAIRSVFASAPGIRTYKDLSPVVASGRVVLGEG
jgi:hypothetical protein